MTRPAPTFRCDHLPAAAHDIQCMQSRTRFAHRWNTIDERVIMLWRDSGGTACSLAESDSNGFDSCDYNEIRPLNHLRYQMPHRRQTHDMNGMCTVPADRRCLWNLYLSPYYARMWPICTCLINGNPFAIGWLVHFNEALVA